MRFHRWAVGLVGAAVLGPAAVPSAGAADPAGWSRADVSDMVLGRAVHTAIDADAQLRGVNLIVSVVNRVAVIGGPVPTDEVGKRAEAVVRGVPGIEDVKNRCFVQQRPDPLLRAVAERVNPGARRPGPTELPGIVPSPRTFVFTPPTAEALPPADNNVLAAVPVSPAPTTETAVVVRKPAPFTNGLDLLLGPPVAPASATTTVHPTPPPPIATPPPTWLTGASPANRPPDIIAAAAGVRQSNPRFAGLTVEVRSGIVVVVGKAAHPADAWDFADQLRKLPGVTRVAVDVR